MPASSNAEHFNDLGATTADASKVIRDFGKGGLFPRGVLLDVDKRFMLLHDKDSASRTAIAPSACRFICPNMGCAYPFLNIEAGCFEVSSQ